MFGMDRGITNDMQNITIPMINDIREWIGATHIVVFARDDSTGITQVATHGKTVKNSKEAAKAGNNLKKYLGWPEELCHDEPLERIHKNCRYYTPDYGIHCMNGWSQKGSNGYCGVEPVKIKVEGNDVACRYFEPK